MLYVAIVLAICLQTDTTVQGRTSMQRGYSEYASGHFPAAEFNFCGNQPLGLSRSRRWSGRTRSSKIRHDHCRSAGHRIE